MLLSVPAGSADLGPLPPSQPVTFSIVLSLPDPSAVQAYDTGLSQPGSPSYHHYLTLQEFAQRFGPSTYRTSDLFAYLASYGLHPDIHGGPFLYTFTGPSGEVDLAFHTVLSDYRSGSVVRYAPTSAPALPVALASLIESVAGLNGWERPSLDLRSVVPSTTSAITTPTVMRGFYDASNLISSGDTGSYYAIGLSEMCDPFEPSTSTFTSDLASFDSTYGLPSATVVYMDTGATSCTQGYPGWGEETDLDMQWAHVMAPGATLYVCLDNSDPDSCDRMFVANHTADNLEIASNSYGWITSDHSDWSAAVAAGMSLFASAGDTCSAVVYPAAEPDGIGVGGTAITPSGGGFGSETAWSCSGSGSSKQGTGGGCDTGDSPPSYQTLMTGYPGPCTSSDRGVPDVAMDAAPSTGVDIVSAGVTQSVGGTSLASPMWAASLDLILEKAQAGGFAAPTLYSLAEGSSYSTLFHDTTTGNNGYPATLGWDPDTGVGTPDIGALASAWPTGGGTGGTDTLTFSVAAPGDGAIVFNGSSYYNGGSVAVHPGNYSLSEQTNPWSGFLGWSATGSVSLTGGSATLWVQGSGSVTATFTPRAVVSFTANPSSCLSSVSFNGSPVGITGTYPLGAGYAASAGACASDTFATWGATQGVSLASLTSSSTSVTLSSNGTLVANYTTPVGTFPVTFWVSPVGDGAMVVQGQDYYNGETAQFSPGSYPISAPAAAWAVPLGLTTTGSVSVGSGQLIVSGSGNVSATFAPRYLVAFSVNVSFCAPLELNGTQTEGSPPGTSATLPAGSYPLRAPACTGYAFLDWSTTGGVAAASPSLNSTQLQVQGNGTVEGMFSKLMLPLYAVEVRIQPASCPGVTIGSGTFANGSIDELAAGTYAMFPSACPGYASAISFSVTGGLQLGTGDTSILVTAAGTVSLLYTPASSGPSVTLTGPFTGTSGTAVDLQASFSGGVAPYKVTWLFADGTPPVILTGITAAQAKESHAFAAPGTYVVRVDVNDSSSGSATATLRIVVSSSGGQSGPAAGLSSPWIWTLTLLAVVAVVVGAVVLIWRRGGRGRRTAEEFPDPAEDPGAYQFSPP